jgi:hypothetical protein
MTSPPEARPRTSTDAVGNRLSGASRSGASYKELHIDGGHVWMYGRWASLANALLTATASA